MRKRDSLESRRLPRWSEVAPLIGSPDWTMSRTERRLALCADLWDVRALAKRQVPRAVFDYTDGAAGTETSLNRARASFQNVELKPRVLRDVAHVDLSREMLGVRAAVPFAFAPTGFTRMMHHAGEPAVARVAAQLGIPYALSTLGTTSMEQLTSAVPSGRHWFQLYMHRDRTVSEALLAQAAGHGFECLIVTVDSAVGGRRLRDLRNGLSIPPSLTARTIFDMAQHPRWWANLLTTRPLEFASLTSTQGTVAELMTRVFDPTLTPADIAWLRERWRGPLMVKGVQCTADALLAVDAGADGVILSNHGGRQLDMAGAPLEILADVTQSLSGRAEVYLDGGIMKGSDVLAAIAMGARGVLVGRAYLYGLMAGGQAGVQRVAQLLIDEIRTAMQLMGICSLEELAPEMVRLRSN